MATLTIIDRSGDETVVEGETGLSIKDTVRNAGNDEMLALCGGVCACATCQVFIVSDHFDRLPPMSEDKNDLLDSSDHRQTNSRLSCQLIFEEQMDGLTIQIAPDE